MFVCVVTAITWWTCEIPSVFDSALIRFECPDKPLESRIAVHPAETAAATWNHAGQEEVGYPPRVSLALCGHFKKCQDKGDNKKVAVRRKSGILQHSEPCVTIPSVWHFKDTLIPWTGFACLGRKRVTNEAISPPRNIFATTTTTCNQLCSTQLSVSCWCFLSFPLVVVVVRAFETCVRARVCECVCVWEWMSNQLQENNNKLDDVSVCCCLVLWCKSLAHYGGIRVTQFVIIITIFITLLKAVNL